MPEFGFSGPLCTPGVYVSAVHPSVNDQCEETGPRFYVSIIEAAIRRGPAPRLPPALEEKRGIQTSGGGSFLLGFLFEHRNS